MTESHEAAKHIADGVATVTVLATLNEWLPPLASLLTIIWFAIRIYETDTVQRLIGRKEAENASKES